MLREVAEYPNSFGPLGPGSERIDTGRYTLCMGPGKKWNTVQRQRFPAEDVDEVLHEVRALLRERGLVPDKDPYAVALVLTREPPAARPELVARRVETFEEYAAANAVQWEAFGMPQDDFEENAKLLPRLYREAVSLMHAVWLDGEIVAAGTASPTEHGLLLYGGATLERARGRGAYRALLRARWDDAVALSTPTLITQGGSMSRPILERTGFEPVGHVHMLLDEFA